MDTIPESISAAWARAMPGRGRDSVLKSPAKPLIVNMIRDDSDEQATQLTPCGRVPGTPLPGRHEIVAQALVRGKTNYEAGIEANYKIGPGLAGNISRLRRTPEMRERMAEIIAIAEEDARIENRWLIADLHLFRKASLVNFWKRDVHGKLVLRRGKPVNRFFARDRRAVAHARFVHDCCKRQG
jgi:hypothetical protein